MQIDNFQRHCKYDESLDWKMSINFLISFSSDCKIQTI